MYEATERLRELLDELGIEWGYGILGAHSTEFNVNGVWASFVAIRDGVTCSTIFTPEQVIQATLGRRTCKCVQREDGPLIYQEIKEYACSRCGHPMTDHDSYCSECGAKVMGE